MPKQKRKADWLEIKKRFCLGEKPKEISKDFDVTSNQISQRAYAQKWRIKKQKIEEKIEEIIENDLISQMSLLGKIFGKSLHKILEFQEEKPDKDSEEETPSLTIIEILSFKEGIRKYLNPPKEDAKTVQSTSVEDPIIKALTSTVQSDWGATEN